MRILIFITLSWFTFCANKCSQTNTDQSLSPQPITIEGNYYKGHVLIPANANARIGVIRLHLADKEKLSGLPYEYDVTNFNKNQNVYFKIDATTGLPKAVEISVDSLHPVVDVYNDRNIIDLHLLDDHQSNASHRAGHISSMGNRRYQFAYVGTKDQANPITEQFYYAGPITTFDPLVEYIVTLNSTNDTAVTIIPHQHISDQ